MNIVRVAEACGIECDRQMVGLVELIQLLEAYNYAQQNQDHRLTVFQVRTLAALIEPEKAQDYRKVPVTFARGGEAANSQDIYDHMERLFASLVDAPEMDEAAIKAFTKSFLYIHPFQDGNGRTAFIIYNWLRGSLADPQPLPDFFA